MTPASDQLIRVRLNLRRYLRLARRHPRWFAMFASSRMLAPRAVGRRLSRPVSSPAVGPASSLIAAPDPDVVVAAVERDGYCTGLALVPGMVERLIGLASRSTCYANADPSLGFVARPGQVPATVDGVPVTVGEYLRIESSPEVASLIADPTLLDVASRYLRGEPHLVEARLWWSPGTGVARSLGDQLRFGQEHFHYDLDDWRCVNFFFYLTDVDEHAGPHTIVRGSHRRRRLRDQLSPFKGTASGALARFYGEDAVVELLGPAGTGFVTDPFAFHMGRMPRHDRLMLKLEMGCGFLGRGPGLAAVHRARLER